MNDKINKLLEEKRKNVKEEDKRQLMLIESMLCNKEWYFKADPDTVASIMFFLGIPKEELKNSYIKLISEDVDDYYEKYKLIDRGE